MLRRAFVQPVPDGVYHRVDDGLNFIGMRTLAGKAHVRRPVNGTQYVVPHPTNRAEGLTVTLRLGGFARLYKVREPVKETVDTATVVTDSLLDGILNIHAVIELPVLAVT